MPEHVTIECPTCGSSSRTTMKASAFKGGWCVGSLDPRDPKHHRPKDYKVVDNA